MGVRSTSMTRELIDPRIQDLLDEVELDVPQTQEATVVGHDPILANRFPVSEAAAAALAAGGVAASDLWELKTGRRQKVRVDVQLELLTRVADTAWGRLTYLTPSVELSETPPVWTRQPVPLGTHAPVWPE